jgi:subtilisin family serine protease
VITRSFVGTGSEFDFWGRPASQHGTACAEVVHDMAPDAQLYLVNAGTEVEWANAVDWLLAQKVDVISFSAGWQVSGPGDGTGTLSEKVNDVREAGVLWVSAAGNSAQRHWMGKWNDPEGNWWHNYTGSDETNEITVTYESQIVVGLRWNDPWGGSTNDYDLFLYRLVDDSLEEVARSDNVQDGNDNPQEFIVYNFPPSGVYYVAISKQAGAQARKLELFSYDQDFHYQTAASSLWIPADSPGSLTVAATYWQDDSLEAFSSQGPTRDGRTKPDLAAPDGVSVRSETWRDTGFYGTSASAPHVAGAAALVLEAFPAFTVAQTQDWLEDRAVDMGTAGKDNVYGAGRLRVPMGISGVSPAAALQGMIVSLEVSGDPFLSTATFSLIRAGYDTILPTDVTWVSVSRLTGTVNLGDAALGFWTAVVTNTPSFSLSLPNAFLVASEQDFLPLIAKNASP